MERDWHAGHRSLLLLAWSVSSDDRKVIQRGISMPDIRYSTVVQAPPDTVWDVITRIERYPDWFPRIKEIRNPRGEPGEAGSTYEVVYELPGGAKIEGRSEIVNSRRPEMIEERFEMSGGITGSGTTTLTDVGDATQLEMEGELAVPGGMLGDVAAAAFSALISGEVDRVMERLKEVCEREAARAGHRSQ